MEIISVFLTPHYSGLVLCILVIAILIWKHGFVLLPLHVMLQQSTYSWITCVCIDFEWLQFNIEYSCQFACASTLVFFTQLSS